MIEVDARVVYWTPDGMRERVALPCQRSDVAYIEKREAERLLEEAYALGLQRGKESRP